MALQLKNPCDYQASYDSKALRGVDNPATPRPWDLTKLVLEHAGPNKTLLDIGCGTAFKTFPFAPYFKQIIGVEPSHSMRQAAEQGIADAKISNISIKEGKANNLPIEDNSIDIVTVMVAHWNAEEIVRVLKPTGLILIESIGCEDKKKFKQFFGSDELGQRGQFLDYQIEDFLFDCIRDFTRYFNKITIENGFWETFYTKEGVDALLNNTPTIRNYHPQLDKENLEAALEACTEQQICLTQNRVLLRVEDRKIF